MQVYIHILQRVAGLTQEVRRYSDFYYNQILYNLFDSKIPFVFIIAAGIS